VLNTGSTTLTVVSQTETTFPAGAGFGTCSSPLAAGPQFPRPAVAQSSLSTWLQREDPHSPPEAPPCCLKTRYVCLSRLDARSRGGSRTLIMATHDARLSSCAPLRTAQCREAAEARVASQDCCK
jgi:hypothetical protein